MSLLDVIRKGISDLEKMERKEQKKIKDNLQTPLEEAIAANPDFIHIQRDFVSMMEECWDYYEKNGQDALNGLRKKMQKARDTLASKKGKILTAEDLHSVLSPLGTVGEHIVERTVQLSKDTALFLVSCPRAEVNMVKGAKANEVIYKNIFSTKEFRKKIPLLAHASQEAEHDEAKRHDACHMVYWIAVGAATAGTVVAVILEAITGGAAAIPTEGASLVAALVAIIITVIDWFIEWLAATGALLVCLYVA